MYASADQLYEYLPQVENTLANTARLEAILARATGIVRDALRAALADPTFDYAAYGAASTKVLRAYVGEYLSLPAHQFGSVSGVAYQTTTSPIAYQTISDTWEEGADGRLYRPGGWTRGERYQITAVWGYGPDVPAAIEEVALELAVNLWRARDSGGYVTAIGAEGEGSVRVVSGLNKLQQQAIANVATQLGGVAV